MKTLFIMRHAKSSWDDESLSDFERPLNQRGLKTAPFMGKLMRTRNFIPDLIVSSPAERAKQTAQLVKVSGKFSAKIRFEDKIYEANTSALLDILSEIEGKFEKVLIVGHNPSFESLVRILTGESEQMPTAALAKISLGIDSWAEIFPKSGKLEIFLRPKEIAKF